jgi:hypothetical protein
MYRPRKTVIAIGMCRAARQSCDDRSTPPPARLASVRARLEEVEGVLIDLDHRAAMRAALDRADDPEYLGDLFRVLLADLPAA